MSDTLSHYIDALSSMKRYPEKIYYKGDVTLLKKPKVSLVGTRRPSNYTKEFTYKLAQSLANVACVS